MPGDRDAVQAIVEDLTPAAGEVLKQVLQLEREHLHLQSVDRLSDDIVRIVKGIVK